MAERDRFEPWARAAIPALVRRARLLTGDHHAAQDLVQDTIAKLYVAWPKLTPTNLDAYAKQTLVHLYVSKRRLRSSTEVVTDSLPESIAPHLDHATRVDVARALARLKPIERALVVARYVDDLPVSDVAALLGRSEAWVRTTSARTLRTLRVSPELTPIGATP